MSHCYLPLSTYVNIDRIPHSLAHDIRHQSFIDGEHHRQHRHVFVNKRFQPSRNQTFDERNNRCKRHLLGLDEYVRRPCKHTIQAKLQKHLFIWFVFCPFSRRQLFSVMCHESFMTVSRVNEFCVPIIRSLLVAFIFFAFYDYCVLS